MRCIVCYRSASTNCIRLLWFRYERCDPNNPNWNNHWGHDDEDHMDHDHDAVMPEMAGEPSAGIGSAFDGVAEESAAESVPVAAAPVADSADAAGGAGSTAAKEQTEDSFGTNNQVSVRYPYPQIVHAMIHRQTLHVPPHRSRA